MASPCEQFESHWFLIFWCFMFLTGFTKRQLGYFENSDCASKAVCVCKQSSLTGLSCFILSEESKT